MLLDTELKLDWKKRRFENSVGWNAGSGGVYYQTALKSAEYCGCPVDFTMSTFEADLPQRMEEIADKYKYRVEATLWIGVNRHFHEQDLHHLQDEPGLEEYFFKRFDKLDYSRQLEEYALKTYAYNATINPSKGRWRLLCQFVGDSHRSGYEFKVSAENVYEPGTKELTQEYLALQTPQGADVRWSRRVFTIAEIKDALKEMEAGLSALMKETYILA